MLFNNQFMIINEDFFDELESENITNDEIDDIVSNEEKKYSCQICLSIWDSKMDYEDIPYEKIVDDICKPLRNKLIYLLEYLPYITEYDEPVFIIHAKGRDSVSNEIHSHNGVLYKLGISYCGHCSSAIEFNIKINHNIHSVKQAYKFAELISTKLYKRECYTYLDCGDEITPSCLNQSLFERGREYDLWNERIYASVFIINFERWCEKLGFFPNGNDIRDLFDTYKCEFENIFYTETKNIINMKKINLKKEIMTDGSCINSFMDIGSDDVEVSAMCFPNYTYDLNSGKSTYETLCDLKKLLNETPSKVVLKPVFGKYVEKEIMSLIFIFKHIYQEIGTYYKSKEKKYNAMYVIRVDLEPLYLVNKYFNEGDTDEFVNYMKPIEHIGFDTKKIISEIFNKVQGKPNKGDVNTILKKIKDVKGK